MQFPNEAAPVAGEGAHDNPRLDRHVQLNKQSLHELRSRRRVVGFLFILQEGPRAPPVIVHRAQMVPLTKVGIGRSEDHLTVRAQPNFGDVAGLAKSLKVPGHLRIGGLTDFVPLSDEDGGQRLGKPVWVVPFKGRVDDFDNRVLVGSHQVPDKLRHEEVVRAPPEGVSAWKQVQQPEEGIQPTPVHVTAPHDAVGQVSTPLPPAYIAVPAGVVLRPALRIVAGDRAIGDGDEVAVQAEGVAVLFLQGCP
mmetsp:Transcript_16528/g.29437  ORF Transcript_16528/g.29437 Transcript_16528/m.29437 type:complete len:250 (+) Transcript_16528:307-1056(+)